MHVRDQALHDVLQTWVGALRVYAVYVLSDVVDCEVFERGNRGSVRLGRGCHHVGMSDVYERLIGKAQSREGRKQLVCKTEA
jgi:hypothetical protein